MTVNSISDLIEDKPQGSIPAGMVPFWDWCKRGLFDMKTLTGEAADCSAVQECIDAVYISSIMSSGNGTLSFNPDWTVNVLSNQVIALSFPAIDCGTGIFSIGNENIDLSCIADLYSFTFTNGTNTINVTNGTSIFVRWFDGLRFNTWMNELHIWLPTGGTAGQVLTRDGATAYWADGCDVCCDFIQDCMEGTITILQNQITLISNLISNGLGGGQIGIQFEDEGLNLWSPGTVTEINFVGDGVTATRVLNEITVDIPGYTPTLLLWHYYGLTAGTWMVGTDYAATVAVKTTPGTGRVPFPQDGIVGGIFRASASSFTLPDQWIYEVTFVVHTTERGQLQVELNGVEIPYSTAVNTLAIWEAHPIVGHCFVTTLGTNEVLAIINPPGNADPLTITPADAGRTRANYNSLTIRKL